MSSPLNLDLSEIEQCVVELHRIGAIKFGDFTLKSGIKSPIYLDLRIIVSYPKIMEMVADLIWKAVSGDKFDHICGVPYTALPVATIIALKQQISMLIRRKEAKLHGTKKLIEGVYTEGQSCLIVEDVIVSGSSVIETVTVLRNEKLEVKEAVVFLDREQGGNENLLNSNINCTSVISIRQMLKILQKHKSVDEVSLKNVMNHLESNPRVPVLAPAIPTDWNPRKLSLKERVFRTSNRLSRRLLSLIDKKKTNLCVAVDVETSEELLSMADKLGPYICLLKTHVDILKDFSMETIEALKDLASTHDFLIFEDRKFADIGKTVHLQYSGGIHRIFDWAHLVTIHGISGPGVIEGLIASGSTEDRGCIIVAEMSSDQNLINEEYIKGCSKLAESYRQFVVGFICQNPIHHDPGFILFTPGISLSSSGDSLGQRYKTPEEAVTLGGADVVIVGRGITKDINPAGKAKEYQERSYKALLERSQIDD